MSNFDLRKFLAEQKAAKTENVKEAHHDEGMDHNEAMDHKDEGMGHKDEAMHHNNKLEAMDHKDEGMGHKNDRESDAEFDAIGEAAIDPMTVAAGVSALFAGAAGLSKLIDKLKAGEFGDRGKKLAQGLEKAGKAAASTTQQRTASGPDTTMDEQEIKENKFKSSIKEILNS